MWRSPVLAVLLAAAALAADNFTCPENEITGKFADPDRCDWYWSCFKGVATPEECADGLVFDPDILLSNQCDYIYKVDCKDRLGIGEPLGTGPCERRNGIYPHEDENVCDQYYTCKDDVATLQHCAPGLHYHTEKKLCDWPASANRGACQGRIKLEDGFACDNKEYFTNTGQKIVHPRFPHLTDCSKFYVCKQGKVPTISGCPPGEVFNAETNVCDLPENVPECNPDYYEDYADYPADAAAGAEATPLN